MKETAMQQPSIFGNLVIDTYTVTLLGFRIPESTSRDAVVENLHAASLRLTAAFPFLAGQVILEGKDPNAGSTGIYHTIPYPPHTGKSVITVKDYTDLRASYDELAEKKAPLSMLDGETLSGRKGFMFQYDMSKVEMPVLLIQASFIKGGLLLNFASQHNALDGVGSGQMMRMFATACRGEPFPPEYLKAGNIDSSLVGRYLQNGEIGLLHPEMRVPSSLGQPPPPPPAEVAPAPWVVWRFRGEKMAELKAKASPEGSWVSTNDAVTAFFWQRVVVARRGRLPDVQHSNVVRAVNGRRCMTFPTTEGYMGHAAFVLPTLMSVEEIITAPLSVLAANLRASIPQINDFYFRSLATAIRDCPDRTTFNYGACLKSGLDMLISSFVALGSLRCGFGELLGKAEFARRPKFDDAEGLTYLMPVTEGGDVDAVTSMREADVKALRADEVWGEFVEYIG